MTKERESVFRHGDPTTSDVLTFAEGIVERFEQAPANDVTDEARLLYALAKAHMEAFHDAMDAKWRSGC